MVGIEMIKSDNIPYEPRREKTSTCDNKDEDQLHDNRKADQRLCFHHIGTCSTISLLSKSLAIFSGCAVSLCRTWSEPPMTDFLTRRLIFPYKVICCGYLLASYCRGDSYRYLQHIILWRTEGNQGKIKYMQRQGTEAIRTQIQPSKPRGEITKITNSQNTKRTYMYGQPSEQLFPKRWSFSNSNQTI